MKAVTKRQKREMIRAWSADYHHLLGAVLICTFAGASRTVQPALSPVALPLSRQIYMAIIRSLAMGKARKSAGNLTFRTVRGRTIASEKRGPNPITRGDGVSFYQFIFALVSRFMAEKRGDIDVSFDKTKYGSQSNGFYKMNKIGLEAALTPLVVSGAIPASISMSEILQAITTYATANPESIIRVKKAGMPIVYLTGEWKSSDNPVPSEPMSVDIVAHNGTQFVPGFSPFTLTEGQVMSITGKGLAKGEVLVFVGDKTTSSADQFEAASDISGGGVTVKTDTTTLREWSYSIDLESISCVTIFSKDGTTIKTIEGA